MGFVKRCSGGAWRAVNKKNEMQRPRPLGGAFFIEKFTAPHIAILGKMLYDFTKYGNSWEGFHEYYLSHRKRL